MPSVFISYSSKDKEFATRLASLLRPYGDAVFVSHDSINAGEDDWKVIMQNLAAADWVLLAATPNACRSKGVQREMAEAHRLGKTVIPLMHGITPEELKKGLGHLIQIKQGVMVDDHERFQAFLKQFGKKVSWGNIAVGIVIGVAGVLALQAIFSKKK